MIKAMIRSEIEMKDSGLAWEKFVPIEWTKCRLKDYLNLKRVRMLKFIQKIILDCIKEVFLCIVGKQKMKE